MVLPTAPMPAPRIGEDMVTIDGREELIPQVCATFTAPANMVGLPAVPIPAGLSPQGLPVGIQFVAPHFEEVRAMRLAYRFIENAPELRRLRSPLAVPEAESRRR